MTRLPTIARRFGAAMLFCALALFVSPAHAQNSYFTGQVQLFSGQAVPNAVVTVCAFGATGIPCTPAIQVAQTDSTGNYTIAMVAGNYVVCYSGAIPTRCFNQTVAAGGDLSNGGTWLVGSTYNLNALVQFGSPASTYVSLVAGNRGNIPTSTLGIDWAIFAGAGAAGTGGPPLVGPNPAYDVTNVAYGAKGDCVTDDTAAINLAIAAWDAGDSLGGATLYFPVPLGGCYLANGLVNWPHHLQNWHTVLMAGNIIMNAAGQFMNMNDNAGSGSLMKFECQSGGQNTANGYGPFCGLLTNSNARTLPMADLRGTSYLRFEGILFSQGSNAGTEAVLGGENLVSSSGMVNLAFVDGGFQCNVATCVPFRQTVAPSPTGGVEFGLSFTQTVFNATASGTYSASFQGQGAIEFTDCYWGGKGMRFENIGGQSVSGIAINGTRGLSENLTNDFLTFDAPDGGSIDGLSFNNFGGLSDNIGTQYLLHVLSGGLTSVLINGGGAGAGLLVDLSGGGLCPSGIAIIQEIQTDGAGLISSGCAVQYIQQNTIGVNSNTTGSGPAQQVLQIPSSGKLGIHVGTNSSCNICSNPGPDILLRPFGDNGTGLGNSFYQFSSLTALFDSSGNSGIGFGAGNSGFAVLASESPNGNRQAIFFDHNNNRISLFSDSGGGGQTYFYGDHAIFPGTIQFTNNANLGIFTGASLTATRTYTFPDISGPVQVTTPFTTLTDASPLPWNVGTANPAIVVLNHATGTRALNVTGLIGGGVYILEIKQDSTGGAAMTLGTGCTWKVKGGGAGAITLTAAANAIDELVIMYDGTNCLTTLNTNFN